MTSNVVVAIPVYNAFEEALDCLRSVLELTPEAQQILVIDDASPEGDFKSYVAGKITDDSRLLILRNVKNLGFVGSCNLAFELAKSSDVLLLNSDTLVTKNWLAKMIKAANFAANIGTVTALSNNAVICSVPRFCLENSIPENMTLAEFAKVVEDVAQLSYPELPTCMGFCVYIRRECLNIIGGFDTIFGRGYGEENDLSQRVINAGFKNICDDATYVFHKGNCSFLGLQADLSATNYDLVAKKHPHFFDKISKFCQANPLKNIQHRIQFEVLKRLTDKPRVLHILHNGPVKPHYGNLGGTELHVQELINNLPKFSHWSLVAKGRCFILTAHGKGVEREFLLDASKASLKEIIKSDLFDLLHLHHTRWFDEDSLKSAIFEHGNYIVSTHDYSLICPQFYLFTLTHKACTGIECLKECGHSKAFIQEKRRSTLEIIDNAKQTVCFSDSTKDNFDKILPNSGSWARFSHANQSEIVANENVSQWNHNLAFKVAFLGYLPEHKGASLIAGLQNHKSIAGIPIEWHVIGKYIGPKADNLIEHGEYERKDIGEKIAAVYPHVVMILSRCPETYSMTLDEAWASAVPVIVTPLGAPAERVKESSAGWVLNDLNQAEILNTLAAIIKNPDEYNNKVKNLANVKLHSLSATMDKYGKLYQEYVGAISKLSNEELINQFSSIELLEPPKAAFHLRMLGKIANLVIFSLDSLGIRARFQKLVYKFLPNRLVLRLKEVR